MSGATTDDGWSTPSLYSGRSRVMEPRTFTEADPMSVVLVGDWGDGAPAGADAGVWGRTTYVGPRRKRPKPRAVPPAAPEPGGREPADIPELAAPGAGDALGTDGTAPAAEQADSEQADSDRGVLANSRSMAVASLISRVTGFLRSSMLVAAIGVGTVGTAYNVGNTLPNMVYELLLGGVLSSVLVPLLVRAQEDDADGGVSYTQRLLSLATVALAAVTLLAVLCAPVLAMGFSPSGAQRSLTSLFATLLLPEIFFYGLGAMFMAVLNIRHSYAPGAWSPVLNNAVMMATIAVFWALPGPHTLTPASMTTTQVLELGIGTTLGIAAQALVLIPALRRTGFRWQWRFRAHPHEVGRMRDVGRLAGWVLVYVVASQIGVTVIGAVGGRHRGAYAVFTQADLLIQMPYGILVVSLLTALMPRLSRAAARGQHDDVIDDFGLGTRLSALTLLPVTAALIVLGQALTILLFAYGRTSIDDARLIGTALAASAFGLFPFAVVMLQLRVFYAMTDGRTPTLINAFMVGTKVLIVLACAATFHDEAKIAVALTTATSASYVVGAVVGHVALTRRFGTLHLERVRGTVLRIAAASVLGGALAYAVRYGLTRELGSGRVGELSSLVLGSLLGLAVFLAVAWRLRVGEIAQAAALVRRR